MKEFCRPYRKQNIFFSNKTDNSYDVWVSPALFDSKLTVRTKQMKIKNPSTGKLGKPMPNKM